MTVARFCIKCGSPLAPRVSESRTRMTCSSPACGWTFWDNPTPVVAAIVQHGDDILLARHTGWPENWWGLITGFLERDETPDAAVAREVKEELALTATRVEFVGNYAMFEMNQLIIAYHVIAEGEVALNEELAAVKRVHIDKLKGWNFGTGIAVTDWLTRRRTASRTTT